MNRPKLRDRIDDMDVAIDLIGRLSVLINLRGENILEPARIKMLAEGIVKYYGNNSPEEIYLACEANQYGKFYTKIEHYGQLTADYISSCLHLYNEERKSAILKQKSREAYSKSPDLEYGYTPIAMWEGAVEYVQNTNELPRWWNWDKAYQHLHESGKLDYLTLEEKNRIKAIVTQQVKSDQSQDMKIAGDMIQYRKAKGEALEEQIRTVCRKYIVLEHLKKHLTTSV